MEPVGPAGSLLFPVYYALGTCPLSCSSNLLTFASSLFAVIVAIEAPIPRIAESIRKIQGPGVEVTVGRRRIRSAAHNPGLGEGAGRSGNGGGRQTRARDLPRERPAGSGTPRASVGSRPAARAPPDHNSRPVGATRMRREHAMVEQAGLDVLGVPVSLAGAWGRVASMGG
jgi:hypothetical protein